MRSLPAVALLLAGCTSSGFDRPVEVEPASEVQTATGVSYLDLRLGDGDEVAEGLLVRTHYVSSLRSGEPLDSSHDRGVPLEFVIGAGEVVTGWEEGMIGMRPGGLRRIVIPPERAYGVDGHGEIPPNATLVLEVELLEVRRAGD